MTKKTKIYHYNILSFIKKFVFATLSKLEVKNIPKKSVSMCLNSIIVLLKTSGNNLNYNCLLALIPTCSLRSEFADTLVASRPEDAFIDLIASSILGATMFSIAVKIAFCILSVSMILLIFYQCFR